MADAGRGKVLVKKATVRRIAPHEDQFVRDAKLAVRFELRSHSPLVSAARERERGVSLIRQRLCWSMVPGMAASGGGA